MVDYRQAHRHLTRVLIRIAVKREKCVYETSAFVAENGRLRERFWRGGHYRIAIRKPRGC